MLAVTQGELKVEWNVCASESVMVRAWVESVARTSTEQAVKQTASKVGSTPVVGKYVWYTAQYAELKVDWKMSVSESTVDAECRVAEAAVPEIPAVESSLVHWAVDFRLLYPVRDCETDVNTLLAGHDNAKTKRRVL